MTEPLADRIMRQIHHASGLYYRLVLVVAQAGRGKTTALQEVRDRAGLPMLNLNLELSRRMLDLTERQRVLQLPRLLAEIVNAAQADVNLLDNIEVLFDVALKQDPLRLLQGLARNKTVVPHGMVLLTMNTWRTRRLITLEYRRYSTAISWQ
ncbi:BREX-3 system P-loop-containing protein BrxF [Candidatus Amarolinea dominans]|uniref:BREX-3 system P-loop-containing protein BrxF n=1 Tax=Candidatus Amarolinea dominans TaxID=3140696 RepID=UPI0031CCC0F0